MTAFFKIPHLIFTHKYTIYFNSLENMLFTYFILMNVQYITRYLFSSYLLKLNFEIVPYYRKLEL